MTDHNREELRRVLIEAEHEWPGNLERRIDAILAVFEAHVKELAASPERANIGADSLYVTPTDDEREALIALHLASYPKTMSDGYSSGVVRTNEEAADLVLTAGFRRTVQGER